MERFIQILRDSLSLEEENPDTTDHTENMSINRGPLKKAFANKTVLSLEVRNLKYEVQNVDCHLHAAVHRFEGPLLERYTHAEKKSLTAPWLMMDRANFWLEQSREHSNIRHLAMLDFWPKAHLSTIKANWAHIEHLTLVMSRGEMDIRQVGTLVKRLVGERLLHLIVSVGGSAEPNSEELKPEEMLPNDVLGRLESFYLNEYCGRSIVDFEHLELKHLKRLALLHSPNGLHFLKCHIQHVKQNCQLPCDSFIGRLTHLQLAALHQNDFDALDLSVFVSLQHLDISGFPTTKPFDKVLLLGLLSHCPPSLHYLLLDLRPYAFANLFEADLLQKCQSIANIRILQLHAGNECITSQDVHLLKVLFGQLQVFKFNRRNIAII